jgi:phage FluMu protein Com
MTQLQLSLRFVCQECEEGIQIKVHCSGSGLKAGPRTVAAVEISCPHCWAVNEVCFHPTGTIVAVRSGERGAWLPLPSLN